MVDRAPGRCPGRSQSCTMAGTSMRAPDAAGLHPSGRPDHYSWTCGYAWYCRYSWSYVRARAQARTSEEQASATEMTGSTAYRIGTHSPMP